MTKRHLVSLLLIGSVLVLISITRVWVTVELEPTAAAHTEVTATGSDGNRAIMPVTIALLAVALVQGIVGRILRVTLGAISALFGVWIVVTTWQDMFRNDDALIRFSSARIAEATGILSHGDSGIVTSVHSGFWPIVTLIGGGLVVLAGIGITVFGWGWQKGGQRYEARTRATGPRLAPDRIADWDALSDGDDPSAEEDPRAP